MAGHPLRPHERMSDRYEPVEAAYGEQPRDTVPPRAEGGGAPGEPDLPNATDKRTQPGRAHEGCPAQIDIDSLTRRDAPERLAQLSGGYRVDLTPHLHRERSLNPPFTSTSSMVTGLLSSWVRWSRIASRCDGPAPVRLRSMTIRRAVRGGRLAHTVIAMAVAATATLGTATAASAEQDPVLVGQHGTHSIYVSYDEPYDVENLNTY
jgi:hypothetical protein